MNTPQHQNSRAKELKETDLANPSKAFDSRIKAQKDLLLGMYCESCSHARHYEGQRATLSHIIMLGTVGLIGVVAQGGFNMKDRPLIIAILLLGAFGAVFTTLYHIRVNRYERRAEEYRLSFDVLVFGWPSNGAELAPRTLHEILNEADLTEKRKEYAVGLRRPFRRQRMGLFRMLWPLFISLFAFLAFQFWRSDESKDKEIKLKTDNAGYVKIQE